MDDRNLLELAAKACGYRVVTRWEFEGLNVDIGGGATIVKWNPLLDDGDALRLAVKLGMRVLTPDAEPTAVADFYPHGPRCVEDQGADPYAATRRAIVRAAAAIGGSS